MATTEITLSFLGGASEIGASSALIQVAGQNILIDCGVRFVTGRALPDLDQLAGKQLDAILVTHAHSDHTGALPVLASAYPGVPIYMTPPTQSLVQILQRDALKLMDSAGREGELPLYSEAQVGQMLQMVRPIHHNDHIGVGDIKITYLPAAHILGASMIHLDTPAGGVMFTGDFSVSAQRSVPALDRPSLPVDLLVTESTYGNRLHSDRRASERALVERVSERLEAGGRVLIPAFAIGRAQEVILILKRAMRHGELPKAPIFVDGMVRAVCNVYADHDRYVTRSLAHEIRRRGHPFFSDEVRCVGNHHQRKEVLDAGPCVIVASSGMLSGGPSVYYAAELAKHTEDAILITGYQDEESPGRALLAMARGEGSRELKLGDARVEVRCHFGMYSLSAHADRMQIAGLVQTLRPRTVVLVHGDQAAKKTLASTLETRDVVCAEDGRSIRRSHPKRATRRALDPSSLRPFDAEALKILLGDDDRRAISIARLVKAWYGRAVPSNIRDALVQQIEAAGLAQREDERRGMLRVPRSAAPKRKNSTQNRAMSKEESALEVEMKRINPKGRLYELCSRLEIAPPDRARTKDPHGYRVQLSLSFRDACLRSKEHHASEKKLAEQLAARDLLEQLTLELQASNDWGEAERLADQSVDALKNSNPKGRLNERCQKQRWTLANFESFPTPQGFVCRAVVLDDAGRRRTSKPFTHHQLKACEQAAAADLLTQLTSAAPDPPSATKASSATPGSPTATKTPSTAPIGNAMMILNSMRQRKALKAFGYDVVDRRGPAHSTTFVMRGWAQDASGARVETMDVEVHSKKQGQRDLAQLLLDALPSDKR